MGDYVVGAEDDAFGFFDDDVGLDSDTDEFGPVGEFFIAGADAAVISPA